MLGELGGHDEYSLVEALKSGKVKKPVVAWVSGTCAKLFKTEVQFGHAGAKSGGASESAQVCSETPAGPLIQALHAAYNALQAVSCLVKSIADSAPYVATTCNAVIR